MISDLMERRQVDAPRSRAIPAGEVYDVSRLMTTLITFREASCYRCGKPGHMAADCLKDKDVCYNCQRRGHVAKDCKKDGQGGLCHARDRSRGASADGKTSRGKSSEKTKKDDAAKEKCKVCKSSDDGGWRNCPERTEHCWACNNAGKLSRHDHSSCQFAIDKRSKK